MVSDKEAKEFNEKNHTHFKQLFKTSLSNRAKHTAHPMIVGVPTEPLTNKLANP